MAITHSLPAPIPITRPAASRLVVRAHNQISVNTRPLPIRSFSKNKVFEDLSAGIVCYRDENGEITCEGFDEGPRFHHQLSRFTCNSSGGCRIYSAAGLTGECVICNCRDFEIVELLRRCWDQVGSDDDVSKPNRGGF